MKYSITFIATFISFVLWGCKTTTILRLSNDGEATIQVHTLHTNRVYSVPAGKTKDIEHTKGEIIVTCGARKKVTYVNVLTPEFRKIQIVKPGNVESKIIFQVAVGNDLLVKVK